MGIARADIPSGDVDAALRWAAICESSADAIMGGTLDGLITSWNAGAEQMYGYTAEEIVGHPVAQLVPPGLAGQLSSVLGRLGRGEVRPPYETKRLRKDGSIIEVSVTVSPILDASGTVIGASTVSRDLTERNRAEAARRALERQLQSAERLETLGRLAGGIAHDFNNLLAAILSYAGFVADETADRPAVRADAEQIQAAAQRAAALTRQLLVFSQREITQPEALDLNVAIDGISNLLSISIGAHVDLQVVPATRLPAIMADRGQIGQILLNLAINARDAMPHGGTLTIATSPIELDGGYACLHPGVKPGPYVELTVRDTGTGMSAEVAAHIYEPFFTTKPMGKGTGLGLSTVHAIVTQAGGSATVESAENAGTTFRFYFPAVAAAAYPMAPDTAPGARGREATILVVDDEPAVLEVTARILRKNGYRTLEAGTYEEALATASSQDFQLLLTDTMMPGMSGATLAELVTEMKPGMPVLHMSGYAADVLSPGRIHDGELAFIQKPFTAPALLDKVSAVLGVPSQA